MLKQAFFDEVGCDILCQTLDFAIGNYKKSTKLWLNNEEDVHDAHDVLLQYGKLTFWCTGKKSKQRYYGSSVRMVKILVHQEGKDNLQVR